MVDTVYLEESVCDHPRAQQVISRYPKAQVITIEKYGEVFNPHAQNFRLQKHNPSLILAEKHNRRVLTTPTQYETGGGANYYFSHMLNCLYDCRYCFLQGMYRSANYLLFVNYEDFISDIAQLADTHKQDAKPAWFFSGYDCDSLALEPVTGFAEYFLQEFQNIPNSVLELRTKSTQIRSLLEREVLPNVVVAYSLSPQPVAERLELGAPSLEKRIQALWKLQRAGWRIGVRFDPIIWYHNYADDYRAMIERVFTVLDPERIDSVTLGGFRLPKGFYKTMRKLYPEQGLFSAGLAEQKGMITYRQSIENEMFETLTANILQFISDDQLYSYPASEIENKDEARISNRS